MNAPHAIYKMLVSRMSVNSFTTQLCKYCISNDPSSKPITPESITFRGIVKDFLRGVRTEFPKCSRPLQISIVLGTGYVGWKLLRAIYDLLMVMFLTMGFMYAVTNWESVSKPKPPINE